MGDCFQSFVRIGRSHHSGAVDWLENGAVVPTSTEESGTETGRGVVEPTTDDDAPRVEAAPHKILLEMIGAMGLESKQQRIVNPSCWVQVYDHQLQMLETRHKTDTVRDDGNPIWTVKSNALCVIDIPADSKIVDPKDDTGQKQDDAFTRSIILDLWHNSTKLLGRVGIPFADVLAYCNRNSDGTSSDRIEFNIRPSPGHALLSSARLALRFRVATTHDVEFLKRQAALRKTTLFPFASNHGKESDHHPTGSAALNSKLSELVAGNGGLVAKVAKSVFQTKVDADGRALVRVSPYPDPNRKKETEWIYVDEMDDVAHQPSTQWVTAGCGSLGHLSVEVIGCNDLPDMDADLSGTDAFCAVTYEDNFVVSDVIWNQNNPRWMPWTTRAFAFAVRHPASLLYLSVLDYDEIPIAHHKPIGRVVLCPSHFRSGLTYVLRYPLQDDPNEPPASDETERSDQTTSVPSRGSVILRLRLEWHDEAAAMKLFRAPPPRLIINVDNKKSYDVLSFTTQGGGYMSKVSIASVKLLANEFMSIGTSLCFAIDVMMGVWLWRGRWQITNTRSVWFPIHSVAWFASSVVVLERPEYMAPVRLCTIAWILFSINHHSARHPNPWLRVPSFYEYIALTTVGRRLFFSSSAVTEIEPNQGAADSSVYEKLDAIKVARTSRLFYALMAWASKLYRIYCKTGNTAVNMSTEQQSWNLFSGKLTPIHTTLRLACVYLRRGRAFVTGKSSYTAMVATNCVLLATVWIVVPVPYLWMWLRRILVWTLLGPWMKLVDMRYFQSWFATKDKLLERIQTGTVDSFPNVPDFDGIFDNQLFQKMIHAGREKAEELFKLKDMREVVFGSFSEVIPILDNSRHPSVPMPPSSAVRTKWDDAIPSTVHPTTQQRGYHVPGQLLTGHMIPSPSHHHDGAMDHVANDAHSESKKSR